MKEITSTTRTEYLATDNLGYLYCWLCWDKLDKGEPGLHSTGFEEQCDCCGEAIKPPSLMDATSATPASSQAPKAFHAGSCSAVDDSASRGLNGGEYDWRNYDEITYSAWLIGRRLAGKPPIKETKEKQDGAASKVSLHPSNWR